jgi:glutamate 5-kinase
MALTFSDIKTLVVKIGTTLLSNEHGFDGRLLEPIVKELAGLKRERNLNLVLVSSGAMGCGMDRLGIKRRPRQLPLRQATAAVGQSRLMHMYEVLFETYGEGLRIAQVLLTAGDLDNRRSYLNVRNTLNALFDLGNIVPIVNENDSTATEEIRFGDNDTLAAKIAAKIDADLLIILSNVDGLYDNDPAGYPDARLIEVVEKVTPEIMALAQDTRSPTSIGGMSTKLEAARIAAASGLPVVIANGNRSNVIHGVLEGTSPRTLFGPAAAGMNHRKRWIAFGRATKGALVIDDGAKDALVTRNTSLLPAGIVSVEGEFEIGEAVKVKDVRGKDVARGLINYSRREVELIKGRKTAEIEGVLGYKDYDEVIHRDNLVILGD